MKYSMDWLLNEFRHHPDTLKYTFFWGHTQKRANVPDDACFSQWFPAPFSVDGVLYKTAEHWMMAGKARLFNDDVMLQAILNADKPGQAKAFGRKVKGFDQETWMQSAAAIVVKGNVEKFSQHPPLKQHLMNTGYKILVEASPVDFIWGIGLAKDHKNIMNPEQWRGLNLLGFALMEARDLINTKEPL